MLDLDMPQRAENALGAARKLFVPLSEHLFHGDTLHVVLRAAKLAGNDREPSTAGIARDVTLSQVDQRPNHDVTPVLRTQPGCHSLKSAAEEHVQEQCL